jgi:hypothetical protein
MKKICLLLLLASPCLAGTITTNFSPIGTLTFSTGTVPILLTTHTFAGSSNTNSITTPGINTVGSSLIVVIVSTYTLQTSGTGLSDSLSNTWIGLNTYANSNLNEVTMFYAANPTTGAAQTFTINSGAGYPALAVLAFSGTPAAPFDSQNGGVTASATTLQPGNVTPSVDNELIVTGLSLGGTGVASINSGFTITDQIAQNGASNYGVAGAYIIKGFGTSGFGVNPTWTNSGSATSLASDITVFK